MADKDYLLDDARVQQFIVDGYLTVQADYPPPFHESIYQKIETVFEKEGNVGNNILPRIPQIQQIFDHPAVRGALTSLLGPGYILNPHRHCHLNPPGSKGQNWHKDCYVFDHNIRHPRFHWVLAFYYPQDTTEDMGPSGLLPGLHACKTISDPDPEHTREPAVSVCGKAGTVALIHFDAWHRATPNVSVKKRYMLKFQFVRTREPQAPAWNHKNSAWDLPAPNGTLSLDVWNWLCGRHALGNPPSQPAISTLIEALRSEILASIEETTAKTPDNAHGTNPTAGSAAMALSRIGVPAVPALVDLLTDDHWWVRTMAVDVLTKIGPAASAATPALMARLADDHWWVRRNGIEALGAIEAPPPGVIPTLIDALADPDYRVRRNAAMCLAKVGRPEPTVVPALVKALEDGDRYNRFYAASALRRIDTREAQNALMDALFTARWCPITTPENRY